MASRNEISLVAGATATIAVPATTAKPPAESKCADDHIARHDIANRNSEPGLAGKNPQKISDRGGLAQWRARCADSRGCSQTAMLANFR
jgi:hypothetical protein